MQQNLQEEVANKRHTHSWIPAPPHEFVTSPPPEWASRPTLIRNKKGYEVGYATGKGYWWECFYDQKAKMLVFRNSSGYWKEMEADINGNLISKRDSNGSWMAQCDQKKSVAIAYGKKAPGRPSKRQKEKKERAKVKREKYLGFDPFARLFEKA